MVVVTSAFEDGATTGKFQFPSCRPPDISIVEVGVQMYFTAVSLRCPPWK
jgi:hypothetical protein